MDHEYVDHADSGTFTTGVINKTYDEKAYREARKQIFDLIGELENSDISPDQKQQIITGLKAILKSNLAMALVIEYFKKRWDYIRLEPPTGVIWTSANLLLHAFRLGQTPEIPSL